ncbi:hypothetical protein [Nonomuraea soli]|uniref:Uncharacterized protein n=1 Tax=Nonomuraea soli TaxID=1032476 RepID=A0A7W0CHQ8_9ACTN|nr:hypothetical protein [Nonomuraea soli]MBA2891390.1 hypothetical protein [Nonomuraea soli]
MLRRIVIGALAAGAFLAASSTAASAATWEGGNDDNVGNAHSPASIVVPVLNHALNNNEVDVLTIAHLERINLNLLTNNTSLTDVEGNDG